MISEQESIIVHRFAQGLIEIAGLAYFQLEEFKEIDYSAFARDFRRIAENNLNEREYKDFNSLALQMIQENLGQHYQKKELISEEKSDRFFSLVRKLPVPSFPLTRAELTKQFMFSAIQDQFASIFSDYTPERRKKKSSLIFLKNVMNLTSFIDFDFPPRSYNIEIFIGLTKPHYPVRICDFFGGTLMISKTMHPSEFMGSLKSCLDYVGVLEKRISTILIDIQAQQ